MLNLRCRKCRNFYQKSSCWQHSSKSQAADYITTRSDVQVTQRLQTYLHCEYTWVGWWRAKTNLRWHLCSRRGTSEESCWLYGRASGPEILLLRANQLRTCYALHFSQHSGQRHNKHWFYHHHSCCHTQTVHRQRTSPRWYFSNKELVQLSLCWVFIR